MVEMVRLASGTQRPGWATRSLSRVAACAAADRSAIASSADYHSDQGHNVERWCSKARDGLEIRMSVRLAPGEVKNGGGTASIDGEWWQRGAGA